MSSYQRLIGEHDGLIAALRGVDALLVRERPRPAAAIAARQAFADLLHAHLAHEDAEVYPALMASSHPATAAVASQFAQDYGALTAELQRYLAAWPDASDWSGFCAATLAIGARLRRRITDENNLLYPTALAAAVITLRS